MTSSQRPFKTQKGRKRKPKNENPDQTIGIQPKKELQISTKNQFTELKFKTKEPLKDEFLEQGEISIPSEGGAKPSKPKRAGKESQKNENSSSSHLNSTQKKTPNFNKNPIHRTKERRVLRTRRDPYTLCKWGEDANVRRKR